MIEFNIENEVIDIKIATNVGWSTTAEKKCPNKMYAVLLQQSIVEKMQNELIKIRREAYEEGWNDHKKRKPKATLFKSWW